ncbi:MAG TPA: flagellar basal body P-ring formation chaperone FlgA [Bryobacteraceae bacterium]|nr:flagellar basal body P-ring formation chaperone FlgA [Bryobacteraceae bacterium]
MQPTCTTIDGDQILTADLARAIPEFAEAPPDKVIGYAPSPGSRRVIRIDELKRLARQLDVAVTPNREACFEWQLAPVSRGEIVAVMRQSLEAPDARIEVLQVSRTVTPSGTYVFPRTGLSRSATDTLWRGYVAYGKGRRFDIWARVRIAVPLTRVVAVRRINAGESIEASQVRLETVIGFPQEDQEARNLGEVVGRVTRGPISAGRPVLLSQLSAPLDVKAGESVEVQVTSGHARLALEAQAANSGREGDMISVRNPKTGKIFHARVEGKGKVLVMVPSMSAVN